MSFRYKHVLMVGATSGIGAAMANRLINEGSKVIAVGRRQDRLDDFVRRHGSEKASSAKFDISDRQKIDSFVRDIIKTHPDIDCVFLNAGTQHVHNLAEPENVDLEKFHAEINTNFSCLVDLSVKFLPTLMNQERETALIYTGTHLAWIPASGLAAYSASKAALSSFIFSLRDQLRNSSVRVIELSPPVVQTELHDYMGPEKGRAMGMPVDAFVDEAYKGLVSGEDTILIGGMGPRPGLSESLHTVVNTRRDAADRLAKMIRGEI